VQPENWRKQETFERTAREKRGTASKAGTNKPICCRHRRIQKTAVLTIPIQYPDNPVPCQCAARMEGLYAIPRVSASNRRKAEGGSLRRICREVPGASEVRADPGFYHSGVSITERSGRAWAADGATLNVLTAIN
jgi:hypothetical protein